MVISSYTHPCDTNTFTHQPTVSQEYIYCNWKSWLKFFLNQKFFHLAIKEISTLKSLSKLFLIKLSADISDSSFVLDSLLKTKIFSNFSAGNRFLFFKRVWNLRLSYRCHFIISLLAWKKLIQLFSIFPFHSIEISFSS